MLTCFAEKEKKCTLIIIIPIPQAPERGVGDETVQARRRSPAREQGKLGKQEGDVEDLTACRGGKIGTVWFENKARGKSRWSGAWRWRQKAHPYPTGATEALPMHGTLPANHRAF